MTFFELLDDEVMAPPVQPDPPCPTGADSRPDPHAPHVLVVHDDPDEGFDIEHPEDCPSFESGHLGCVIHECALETELEYVGMSDFFTHIEDGFDILAPDAAVLMPGRYLIEWQIETSNHWEYGPEHRTWIQLLYPEEAQQPARP